jgi:RNA polymerase-binding protein DksA
MLDKEFVRKELLAKRHELEERVSRISSDLHRRQEPLSADFAEQVVEQENLDVLYSLESEGRSELALVEKALDRLARDDYGNCRMCGDTIAEARLAALPYADTCINCAV